MTSGSTTSTAPTSGPRRVCEPRLWLFEAAVTTDRRQRVANQNRLRILTAEHPGIDVFCAHDPAPLTSPSPRPAAPTQQP